MVLSIIVAINAFLLAKEKGQNVMKWTILGAIPLVNFACMWFFIGATNLRTEKKLDDILAELKKTSQGMSQ
jgi:hypothetical protein